VNPLREGRFGADTHFVEGEEFAVVLAAAQRGDELAFSRLWRDANPGLMRYLRAIAADSADDVAAETWITVVRGLAKFRGDEAAWRAWLFTTARRRLFDLARQRKRQPYESTDDLQPWEEPSVPDASVAALENLGTERAIALVARLPRGQAEVVMLRVVAGLSTEQVAHIVGSSPGAVRVTAHRALRRLAALLEASGVTI
jgi:RNA polymerase sigma-70 factor (ECF subfamily)